jgi:DNA-binding LacI/PurR family transcriptional regulator
VSRVLTGKPHVSEAVRARVLEAATVLNYRPNRIARSLRVQRSRVVGLVISDIQNPFFSQVVRAVEDTLYPHGFAVFLCNTDENPARERLYLDLLLDEQVAGIILTPTQADGAAYRTFASAGMPLMVIDREVTGLGVDTVVSNNREASQEVVAELVRQGHTRVGAILSDLSIATGRERFEGYRCALADAGLAFDASLAVFGKPVEAEGYRLAESLFGCAAPPTALFTGSKLLTLGALRYLYDYGVRVPEAVALASFDALDWLPNSPTMLSVEQPAYEIGARAAGLLLRRIKDPERPVERVVLPSAVAWVGRQAAKPLD